MNYSLLIGKILADKDSRRLGLIVDIILPPSDIVNDDGDSTILVVKVERPLRKVVRVQINANLVSRVQDIYAWCDLSKKDFMEAIKKAPKESQRTTLYQNIDLTILKNYRGGPPRG